MCFDYLFGDRKAEAKGSFAFRAGPAAQCKRIEYLPVFAGGNADAVVLDSDPVILTIFGKGNEDLIALAAEFDRIADEVAEYPAELSGVRPDQL